MLHDGIPPLDSGDEAPWLDEDKMSPLIQAYEARIRELTQQAAMQAKANADLKRDLESLITVSEKPTLRGRFMLL